MQGSEASKCYSYWVTLTFSQLRRRDIDALIKNDIADVDADYPPKIRIYVRPNPNSTAGNSDDLPQLQISGLDEEVISFGLVAPSKLYLCTIEAMYYMA